MGKGSKPKAVTPPPPPDPVPVIEKTDEAAGDEAMAKAVQGSSRRKTYLTGNLSPTTNKKKRLG